MTRMSQASATTSDTTMKLVLSLASVWTLLSSAEALNCLTCTDLTDVNCASTTALPCATDECVTANNQGVQLKACAPSGVCPAPGSQTWSLSTYSYTKVASGQCCNTDNCNSAKIDAPVAQSVNSLQCYTCDPTYANCSVRMQCKGVEDRCFQMNTTVGSVTVKESGCASAGTCTAVSTLLGSTGTISIKCCSGNLCNSATVTTVTSLSFLLGLLVFSLYQQL